MSVAGPFLSAARVALVLTAIGTPAYVVITGPAQSETTIKASD
jgi:hypothetical protein